MRRRRPWKFGRSESDCRPHEGADSHDASYLSARSGSRRAEPRDPREIRHTSNFDKSIPRIYNPCVCAPSRLPDGQQHSHRLHYTCGPVPRQHTRRSDKSNGNPVRQVAAGRSSWLCGCMVGPSRRLCRRRASTNTLTLPHGGLTEWTRRNRA